MLMINDQKTLLKFIQSELSGENNLSIIGLARLCGVRDTSLIRGSAFTSAKLGQKLTAQGFEASALVENGFNAKATWLVIEYYAYESKAKAEGAKMIARTFGSIGVMTTFDKLQEAKSVAEVPPLKQHTAIEYIEAGKTLETLQNPMIKSLLEQRFMEEVSSKLMLQPETKMCVLTVRAKELGVSDKLIGNGSALGKYVKQFIEPAGQQQHGRYKVNVYEVNDYLDETILSKYQ